MGLSGSWAPPAAAGEELGSYGCVFCRQQERRRREEEGGNMSGQSQWDIWRLNAWLNHLQGLSCKNNKDNFSYVYPLNICASPSDDGNRQQGKHLHFSTGNICKAFSDLGRAAETRLYSVVQVSAFTAQICLL